MTSAARNSNVTPFAPARELHSVPSSPPASGPASTLVSAVRALQELEDDILGVLTESDRLFHSLDTQRIYEDAGFASFEQMEDRLLDPSSMLRGMRMAVSRPAYEPRKEGRGGRRRKGEARPTDERARRIQGLGVLSQSLAGLRLLEERLRTLAESVSVGLEDIESQRLYDDCGYSSAEECMARAVAPSPVLAAIAAILAEEPAPSTITQDDSSSGGFPPPASGSVAVAPAAGFADLSDVTMLENESAPGNDFLTGAGDAAHPASRGSHPPAAAAPAAKPARGPMILAVALAVVAALAGGAAGFFL